MFGTRQNPSARLVEIKKINMSSNKLMDKLTELYWEGLTREISQIIQAHKLLENQESLVEEEQIETRLPQNVFGFLRDWAPWDFDIDREYEDFAEGVTMFMAARQKQDRRTRRARMLLQGLSMLDIDRLVEFREPLLISQAGAAQVNIVQVPQTSGKKQPLIHLVRCCDCKKAHRTSFYLCISGCVHHEEDNDSRCNWAKHQFSVCLACYASTSHARQHLQKTRPYDPLSIVLDPPMTQKEGVFVRSTIRNLQQREDQCDDDERSMLRTVLRATPEEFVRKVLPFGNVHSSVTLGPLIFEIGATGAKGGALISLRSPPDLAYSDNWKYTETEETTPTIAVSPDRQVFSSVRRQSRRKVHASLKQVMGGVFSGHLDDWRKGEVETINCFLRESARFEEQPMKSAEFNKRQLRRHAVAVVHTLRPFIADDVQMYLFHFAWGLMDTSVNLKWNQFTNNCQAFCNNLLAGNRLAGPTFDSILPRRNPKKMTWPSSSLYPRYLLSFASRDSGYVIDPRPEKVVPSAAYFDEFHSGEDMIEYLSTWPAIPRHHPCSQLFCWPCQDEKTCSLCTHAWLMPLETMSILQLHLIRGRSCYDSFQSDNPTEQAHALTDGQWMKNRLQVLLALDSFMNAAGALSNCYQDGIDLLPQGDKPRTWKPPLVKGLQFILPPGSKDHRLFYTRKDRVGGMITKWLKPFQFQGRSSRWFKEGPWSISNVDELKQNK